MDSVIFEAWISDAEIIDNRIDNDFGNGSGDIDGSGEGHGSGPASGWGVHEGTSYGFGLGDGYGAHMDYGYAIGNGSDGCGNGSGEGLGTGYGSAYRFFSHISKKCTEDYGFGFGFDYRSNYVIKRYNNQKVYYLDSIPCLFQHIKNNIAVVGVIGKDMMLTPMAVSKENNRFFAQGDRIGKVTFDIDEKHIEMSRTEVLTKEFLERFKSKDKYPAKDFLFWHGILTRSVEYESLRLFEENGIDLENGTMRVDDFFDIAKDAYGWETIKKVRKKYNEKLLEKLLNR